MHRLILPCWILVMSSAAGAQFFEWAVSPPATAVGLPYAVIVDDDGSVYVTGFFSGTMDFDPGPGVFELTSAGEEDAFLLKLDAAGDFQWAVAISGTEEEVAFDAALDALGNVYLVGNFRGQTDFDPGPGVFELTAVGPQDIFVLALDAGGSFLWAGQLAGAPPAFGVGSAIEVDETGSILLTGAFEQTIDFDPGPGVFNLTSIDNRDAYVCKLDGNGDFVWAVALGGSDRQSGLDIATDEAGNVFAVGEFEETVDFDPGPGTDIRTSNGNFDVFVSSLDQDGNYRWTGTLGGVSRDEAVAVGLGPDGTVHTFGVFEGTVDFDPGPGTVELSFSNQAGYIQKLDNAGDLVWVRGMGGDGILRAADVAVTSSGQVHVIGDLTGQIDFDPGPDVFEFTGDPPGDVYVAELDEFGSFGWAGLLAGSGINIAYGVAADDSGGVFTTGTFTETMDFDPGPGTFEITAPSTFDVFVSKLGPRPSVTEIPTLGLPELIALVLALGCIGVLALRPRL